MNINPAGVLLVVLGVVAFLVGLRGSQSQTLAAITGKSATAPPSKVALTSTAAMHAAGGAAASAIVTV